MARVQLGLAVVLVCGLLFANASGGVWLDVPFVKQERNGCGAACIAMIIQYWANKGDHGQAREVDAAAIRRTLYSDSAHGIYASELVRYFQQHGFRTFTFRGEWQVLEHHIALGRPVIVALKRRGDADSHYVVVAGMDTTGGFLLVNDPAQRKLLKVERSEFEKEWSAVGAWTLLAVPRVDH